jgi:hypothetical protein
LDQLEPFRQLLANLFALRVTHRFFELFVELVEVDLSEKFFHRFRAHAGDEVLAVLLLRLTVFDFVQQLRFLQWRLTGVDNDVILVVNNALELPRAHIEHKSDARRHAFVKPNMGNRHG